MKTKMGIVYLAAAAMACGMVITIYSLPSIPLIKAVPLMLLSSPFLGNMALCFPQEISAVIDVVLVLSVVLGTKNGRGPLSTILDSTCASAPTETTIFICIEVTLLISTTLTATLAITRERRVEQALQIKIANDDRVTFFSHVSHEFRTPLSVIIGYTEDVLENLDLPLHVHADLENVLNASIGLSTMVEDLLALFRLEKQELVIVPKAVQTKEFFSKFFSFATRLASAKNLRVEMVGMVPEVVVFDPTRANQVLTNLVANAVKFTPSGGKIVISAKIIHQENREGLSQDSAREPDRSPDLDRESGSDPTETDPPLLSSKSMKLVIADPWPCNGVAHREGCPSEPSSEVDQGRSRERSCREGEALRGFAEGDSGPIPAFFLQMSVIDSGIGIKPEDLSRLFERFFRCQDSGEQGTGLGLSIGANIAKAMGGSLTVASEFGVGSTFTITVPVTDGHIASSSGEEDEEKEEEIEIYRRFVSKRDSTLSHAGNVSGVAGTASPREASATAATAPAASPRREDEVAVSPSTPPPMLRPIVPRRARESDEAPQSYQTAAVREKYASLPIELHQRQRQRPQERPSPETRPLRTIPKESRRNEIRSHGIGDESIDNRRGDAAHRVANSGATGEGRDGVEARGRSAGTASPPCLKSANCPILKVNILLAEDSIPNQKLMIRILERVGHTVEAVEDGQAAIDALCRGCFDLLVLDLGLPIKTGMEVLRELRSMQREDIKNTPVIISSGHVLDEHRQRCLAAGCNAFTEKPFRAKIILDTVQRVMKDYVLTIAAAEDDATADKDATALDEDVHAADGNSNSSEGGIKTGSRRP